MSSFFALKRRQQLHLEEIAFVDNDTGGNTYAKFEINVQEILSKNPNQEFSILTFDVDNFKYINNVYGVEAGDKVLYELYRLYNEILEENETIARVNADHFVILLKDATTERIKKLHNQDIQIDNIKLYLSTGIYNISDREENISSMMDKSNMAARKGNGTQNKKVQVYSEDVNNEIREEKINRDVESAIGAGEIVPFSTQG